MAGTTSLNDSDTQQASGTTPEASDVAPTPGDKEKSEADPQEKSVVDKRWRRYTKARKFDENYRKQIAVDRRYAAGTSDPTWAVDTNVIGAFIDILTALLYARDPDVSVRKAPQTDEDGTRQNELFAKTLEIVISQLWRRGKLKKRARKMVRSTLSVAEGWIKAMMVSDKIPQPQTEAALNDARDSLDRLTATQHLIDEGTNSTDETNVLIAQKKALIETLQTKIELSVSRMFVIDFVEAENIQVSQDVQCIEDYLDADWIGHELFLDKEDVLARFSRLTEKDLESAKCYYQRQPKEMTTRDVEATLPQGNISAESAQNFTESGAGVESEPFYRVVESWSRTDKHIYTMMDGVQKWLIEPYEPPYPTSRFYPFFYLAFFEVTGSRHPQSLSWRLYKLQDEFSSVRSNYRLTRQRSIPAVLFNSEMMDDEQASKLEKAKIQEYIGLKPQDPSIPLANLFAAKPVAAIDPRLFDTTMILSDMERIAGVQEALQSTQGAGTPITATQANLQQAGTNARTTSDRDNLEWMLTDLAQYTAEQAIQCLTPQDAQRMAGDKAWWPHGMSVEDLFTLVEVTIDAGSTGKPRQQSDQQSWGVVLPLIRQILVEIVQAEGAGNMPLANALKELIKETMLRFGDTTDAERFIPTQPPPGSPGAGAKPTAPPAEVKISLTGQIDPATAAALVAPTVQLDNQTVNPPPPPGGAPGAPGGSPAAPAVTVGGGAGTPQVPIPQQ